MLLEAQADLEEEDGTLYERTDDYDMPPANQHQLRQDNSTTNIVIVGQAGQNTFGERLNTEESDRHQQPIGYDRYQTQDSNNLPQSANQSQIPSNPQNISVLDQKYNSMISGGT